MIKMGNPCCTECKVRLETKEILVEAGDNSYGRRRVWKCPKCGRHWKKGAEAIVPKPAPKPRCYARKFDTLLECPTCKDRDKCSETQKLNGRRK